MKRVADYTVAGALWRLALVFCRIARSAARLRRGPAPGLRATSPRGDVMSQSSDSRTLKGLLAYCRAVLRQWVALMTGSLLVAVYELLPLVAPNGPGRTYPWNHLPPWIAWILAVLALFVAQCRAWLEMWEAPAFTSEGLTYSSSRGSIEQEKFVVTAAIRTVNAELPQPLTLRMLCSEEPEGAFAILNRINPFLGDGIFSPPSIDGNCVTIVLKEPMLTSTMHLSVKVVGRSKEPFYVEKVERLVAR
jgi:hypothetical protein